MVTIAFPFLAALAGWVLTEVGRQPWIVQGLLRTSDAASPNVSTAMLGVSLGVFACLYGALAVADFVLMRRYASPSMELGAPQQELPAPAVTY